MARRIIKKYRYSRRHLNSISRKKLHSSTSFGHRNYSLYVHRILKAVDPQRSMWSCTLDLMNSLINNILDCISTEACNIMRYRNRCTLTPEHIQRAVYLLLPGELAKRAVAYGSEAVNRYVHS